MRGAIAGGRSPLALVRVVGPVRLQLIAVELKTVARPRSVAKKRIAVASQPDA